MFVDVCLDVPASQLDRLFTYQLPQEFEEIVEVGSRVKVPLGRRQVMGFVIKIHNQAPDFDLRPVSKLLDYQSYLNQELVDLSAYMANDLQVFRISILQAMLPSMLKVKYQNLVRLIQVEKIKEDLDQAGLQALERLGDGSSQEDFEAAFTMSQIKRWLKSNYIQIDYQVLDQKRKKTQPFLKASLSQPDYQKILAETPKSYHKQVTLLGALSQIESSAYFEQDKFLSRYKLNHHDIKSAIDKGWLERIYKESYRNPIASQEIEASQARPLKLQQAAAYQVIKDSIQQGQDEVVLLEGVTGSGKTEVYLQAIQVALNQGKGAILLVPEIALTPQMIDQVYGRFQDQIAVLHSGLSPAEKFDEWRRILKAEAKIVVGARSSIFAPISQLGLIIIDEEHETTYKQADNPRYHARDVAIWRSNYHQCPLILGSATPSLESRARAQKGNYKFLRMDQRVNHKPLPPVEIIDMTKVGLERAALEISPRLQEEIQNRLDRQEQVILLLNRRGYASYLLCRECGHVLQCPHCDISLTYHKVGQRMKCHYCDYQEGLPQICPTCLSPHIQTQGLGTQKIVETLEELFPKAGIIRMDNDTTRRKGAHARLLKAFGKQKADILVGTQMIAKGLDFENVTLVGVINADSSLNISDFRAGERTFQLLTQVAGRTGRGRLPGQVLIQTYNPNHYVIQLAKTQDYEGFFQYEMHYRHLGNYPPYFFTSLIRVSSKKDQAAKALIYQIRSLLQNQVKAMNLPVIILGPSQAPIARINNYYYYQILIKYKEKTGIKKILGQIMSQYQDLGQKGLFLSLDHEPLFFI